MLLFVKRPVSGRVYSQQLPLSEGTFSHSSFFFFLKKKDIIFSSPEPKALGELIR